jgi:hypothetical protein
LDFIFCLADAKRCPLAIMLIGHSREKHWLREHC